MIIPQWPAPAWVRAISTTRDGGVSQGPYATLNLGDACGDAPDRVAENRRRLAAHCQVSPVWLKQQHGTRCIRAEDADLRADACWTDAPGHGCFILTADCLPILVCHRTRRQVAAAHAGWRGLAEGVIESTLASFDGAVSELLAWIGPGIGAAHFEVGPEVRQQYLDHDPDDSAAFSPSGRPDHWLADLPALARARLTRAGVTDVTGGTWCTYADPDRFFSYRRDGVTGRHATGIWLACE